MTEENFKSGLPDSICPSLEELAISTDETSEEMSDEMSALEAHLAQCARCRARFAVLQAAPESEPFSFPSTLGVGKPIRGLPRRVRNDSRLEFGAICSIASDERPGERLIVVVIGGRPVKDALVDGPITVVPISVVTQYASNWDVLVDASDLDLAYDCMVETWNYGQIARVQLDEAFGSVHPSALHRLELVWQAIRKGDEVAPDDAGTGPRILSAQDPRIAFQSDEVEGTRSFYTPHVTQVRELAGSLVTRLRERAATIAEADEPPTGSVEAEVLAEVRGRGYIAAPDGHALGKLISLLGVDVGPGTPEGDALEEEASAWIENERFEPALVAARGSAIGRVRGVVGRLIPGHAGDDRLAQEVAAYVETVRRAAAEPRTKSP